MFNKKIFCLVSILWVFLNVALADNTTKKSSPKLNRIVAIVNDKVITQAQLANKLSLVKKQMEQANVEIPDNKTLHDKVLQDMIDQSAELQVAAQTGIQVSDEELSAEIANIAKKNNVTVAELSQSIQALGMNFDQYRDDMRNQLIIHKLIQRDVMPKITVSEQDITEFLNTQPLNQDKSSEQYHLKDFMIPLAPEASTKEIAAAKKQAEQLAFDLRAGKQINQAQFANDLGWRPLSELPTEFVAKVKLLQTGNITDPIQAPNGFHIIKLLSKRQDQPQLDFKTQKLVQLEIILLKKPDAANREKVAKLAEEIYRRLSKGTAFADLAQKYSQDASAKSGGYVGWIDETEYPKAVIAATNLLKSGEYSRPISTEKGWYIVLLSGKKEILKPKEAQHRAVSAMVFQKKFREKMEEYVTEIRNQLNVKIM